ncbi:HNH endonuclease [Bradyrhizobium elkanii]|uniref:HNH endonuclease n=1 Tax=Bradyrhizobium elkanii TaxID=29448 RepID=UPI0034E3969C
MCQICGDEIDRDLVFPHPRSVSLDHIIPISRGGVHRRDNTQCAHLGCNSSKGNKLRATEVAAA